MSLTEQELTSIIRDAPPGMFLLAYRGSVAHGMYTPGESGGIDDVDLIGFVAAPIEHYLGLTEWHSRGTWERKEGRLDLLWYEARKTMSLLLAGNPNIITSLWLKREDYKFINRHGMDLVDRRRWFLGKHIYKPFAGYAAGQLHRMSSHDPAELESYLELTAEMKRRGIHPNKPELAQQDRAPGCGPEELGSSPRFGTNTDEQLRERHRAFIKKNTNLGYLGDRRKRLILERGYDTKNAAHCVRLLRMLVEVLSNGVVLVDRREAGDAEELLDIKNGKWSLPDVKAEGERLFAEAKEALKLSTLPDGPNRGEAENWLVGMLRSTCVLDQTGPES